MLSFIWRSCPRQCLQLNQPPPLNRSRSTASPGGGLPDTDPPRFNSAPSSPSIIQRALWLWMRLTTAPACLPSRSHRGQLYQPDYSSQPELRRVENAVPLAASLGTEQASAVWSPSQAQANLACRGLRRIGLMKYIYDRLQTCIVPRCCVLSGRLHPHVCAALQSETVQGQIVRERGTRNAEGLLAANRGRWPTSHLQLVSTLKDWQVQRPSSISSALTFLMDAKLKSVKR